MKKALFSVLAMAAILFAGCQSKYDLSSEVESIEAPQSEWTDSLVIYGSNGKLSVDYAPEWIKAETSDSTLIFTFALNDTQAERNDSIVVRCGASSVSIPVTQVEKASYLHTPDGTNVNFGKEGGTQELKVETDGVLEIKNDIPGLEASYKGDILTLKAAKNEGKSVSGKITVTAGDLTADINVTIAGNVCPTCNGTGKIKCRDCGGAGYHFDPYNRESYGCKSCGGSGFRNKFNVGTTLRPGSGKQTCPTCHGKGQ